MALRSIFPRHSRLLVALLLLVSCSTWLHATSANGDCPITVNNVLASADYRICRQDIASSKTTTRDQWVLTHANADVIDQSPACQATLRALHAIEFDICVTSISSNDATRVAVRVVVDKAALSALVTSTTRGLRLRRALARVLQTADGGDSSTTFNYNYLYGAAALFVVVLVVSLVLSRGGACCFCIPIPICC